MVAVLEWFLGVGEGWMGYSGNFFDIFFGTFLWRFFFELSGKNCFEFFEEFYERAAMFVSFFRCL